MDTDAFTPAPASDKKFFTGDSVGIVESLGGGDSVGADEEEAIGLDMGVGGGGEEDDEDIAPLKSNPKMNTHNKDNKHHRNATSPDTELNSVGIAEDAEHAYHHAHDLHHSTQGDSMEGPDDEDVEESVRSATAAGATDDNARGSIRSLEMEDKSFVRSTQV